MESPLTPSQPPPLLCIPFSVRRRILVLAGLPHHEVFYMDSPWRDDSHPRGEYGPTTTPSFHASKEKMKSLRPGLDLTISLLLSCKTVSSEVSGLFYANNTFITKRPEPLLNLGTQSLASLTDLHVLLTSLRCVSEYLCNDFYPWNDRVIYTPPEVTKVALDTWKNLAPFLGKSVNREHRLNLSLRADLIHYSIPTPEEIHVFERILDGLAYFPPLRSCRVSLANGRRIHIKIPRQMSREAARKATFQEDFKSRPFRYMDLPLDIRLQILKFTDLVAPEQVLVWRAFEGYVLFRRHDFSEKCKQVRFGRATSDRDWFCQVHGGHTPLCRCWDHPTPLFLVSKAFLADARHVFHGYHHIQLIVAYHQVKGDRNAFAGYAGNEFARTALEPALWCLLQSVTIELNPLTDDEADASALADWWRLIDQLRASPADAVNLRFLRLSIRCFHNVAPPGMEKAAALEPEPRIDALRKYVNERWWPLDAGETSSLPFGTRHLEVHISESWGLAMYRIRQLKQRRQLSQAERKMEPLDCNYMQPKAAEASRVLIGGNADRHCRPEPGDDKPHTDADWIEDVWFRI